MRYGTLYFKLWRNTRLTWKTKKEKGQRQRQRQKRWDVCIILLHFVVFRCICNYCNFSSENLVLNQTYRIIVSYICLHTTLLFGIVLMCWEKFFVGHSCKCATSQLWSSEVCHLQCVTILQEKKRKKERKYFDICFRGSCALFCGRVCRL